MNFGPDSQPTMWAAYPHIGAPGAPCPRWAHHKAILRGEQLDNIGTEGILPDNALAVAFVRTIQRD